MKPFIDAKLYFLFFLLLIAVNISAQSGGPISPEQAAYDVKYYHLDLSINPDTKTIKGSLLCEVEIVNSITTLVLDLDNPFTVDSVLFGEEDSDYTSAAFNHSSGKINITIPVPVEIGEKFSAKIFYEGAPRISTMPPWSPGFVWQTTPSGKPWIGVACEDEGADVWWPCKDHPSDEPDSMSMSFTVPNPLTCVSNGKFMGSSDNGNGTSTFNWFISTPINNYNVTIYAAEYSLIEDTYLSTSGDSIPFYFWVLQEVYTKAINYMDVFLKEFNFLETVCGPFPFGNDKHGWAHAPYWGMEHQTIVAYGHDFTLNNWGYDYIHYHELAHEWWGNLITAKSWSDVWIHEGIATYTEALYVEHLHGKNNYLQFMNSKRPGNNHIYPLAPHESLTAEDAFNYLNPYSRGAAVMHTLRFHLGDQLFFKLLKRWAYPDSTDLDNSGGRFCRIYSTDDMKNHAEEITGVELDPFFNVFFREAKYPVLKITRENNTAAFTWITSDNIPLDVDIPIIINGNFQKVEMTDGQGSAVISISDDLIIDPEKWILMASPLITNAEDDVKEVNYQLYQNFPNPFNPGTIISYSLPEGNIVELSVNDILGNKVAVLVNEYKEAGEYLVKFDGNDLPSGLYFYTMRTAGIVKTKKLLLMK